MFGLPDSSGDNSKGAPVPLADSAGAVLALLLGFARLPVPAGLDQRRRPAQALRLFSTWARKALFVNAAGLLLAYASAAVVLLELHPAPAWLAAALQSGRGVESALLGLGLGFLQAQVFVHTMRAIHRKLLGIALADR